MNFGGITFLAASRRDSAVGLVHARAHLSERREVVGRVFLCRQRMPDRERFHQVDVCAAHLLQGEAVVEVRLFADHQVELPLHQLGRDTLGFVELGAIEFCEIGESPARQLDSRAPVDQRFRR